MTIREKLELQKKIEARNEACIQEYKQQKG